MANEGKRLSQDEVVELEVYKEKGIAPPDKYDDAVFDASVQTGAHYRWKTAAEKSAEGDAAKDAAKTVDARQKVVDRIQRRDVSGAVVSSPPTPTPVVRTQ